MRCLFRGSAKPNVGPCQVLSTRSECKESSLDQIFFFSPQEGVITDVS